jgi:hypothetical protein
MSNFTVSRSTVVAASADSVQALVDDLRAWRGWSPWEELDPAMERTYSGPDSGVGAVYAWKGNSKAGAGSMEVTASQPGAVAITLAFLKPWKAVNQVAFTFAPTGGGTEVTWTMSGAHAGLGRVFALFMSMDKLVGKDFERGLAALKNLSEQKA